MTLIIWTLVPMRLWRGQLRLWDGQALIGWYAANDGDVTPKGTMYCMLHAQGNQAEGRWVGLSYDGPILTGHATLARTREDAQAAMRPPHRPFRRPSMTDTDLVEVTITAPDLDWLTDLCHQVVDARLASSAYVIHPITSIYSRDDDVQLSSAD